MAPQAKTKKKSRRRQAAIFFIVLILILASLILTWSQQTVYATKFLPNTSIGPVVISKLNFADAEETLNQALENFQAGHGLIYHIDSFRFTLEPKPPLANLDSTLLLATIWQQQHPNRLTDQIMIILKSLTAGFHYSMPWQLNEEIWQQEIKAQLGNHLYPAQSPRLNLTAAGDLELIEEVYGQIMPWPEAKTKTEMALANLNNQEIILTLQSQTPEFTRQDITQEIWNQLNNFILPQKNLTLVAEKTLRSAPIFPATKDSPFKPIQKFTIKKTDWLTWLNLNPNNTPPLGLNETALADYLKKNLAESLEQEPEPASIKLSSSSRVTAFSPGVDGWKIDLSQTANNLTELWLRKETSTIPLVLNRQPAGSANQTLKDLGLIELLGVGQSNFKGSPKNRRHNIATGAAALRGLIIKPNEEFSLISHLLPVDETTGYLPELVIKGNKTTPEYGGGLCQIGTTLFRATLATGLPVLERRNHSYRVVYYEPAGTDATIYDPKPDYRFKNDTGNNLLIWTKIIGDNAYFEFWGTPDGRLASQTTPYIYNIVAPGPSKLIVSPDLKPGEKKCTEKPHAGANARFTYTITYANGSTSKETFYSHYVPWPEVCLIGATSTPALNSTASTTDSAFISDLNQNQ